MYKPLLKANISRLSLSPENDVVDLKSKEQIEITNFEFALRHRDFSKITKSDLDKVFHLLRERCPETWTEELETRAKELNGKLMRLKNGNTSIFIDPDTEPLKCKAHESEV